MKKILLLAPVLFLLSCLGENYKPYWKMVSIGDKPPEMVSYRAKQLTYTSGERLLLLQSETTQQTYNRISISDDKGKSFTELFAVNSNQGSEILEFCYHASGYIYAIGTQNAADVNSFFIYNMGSQTLTQMDNIWGQRTNSNPAVGAIEFITSDIGFVGNDEGIYRTEDQGSTWSLVDENTNITSIHFIDETVGYATSANGRLLFTVDAGESWSVIYEQTGESFDKIEESGMNFVIGGSGVWHSSDAALTWTKVLDEPIKDFALGASEAIYTIDTDGASFIGSCYGEKWSKKRDRDFTCVEATEKDVWSGTTKTWEGKQRSKRKRNGIKIGHMELC